MFRSFRRPSKRGFLGRTTPLADDDTPADNAPESPPPADDGGQPPVDGALAAAGAGDAGDGGRLIDLPIEQELKESYLTYAMSVIVSRALPDVRDGLKPSQRRILVAMNDLNLSPGSSRVKCAKISGDTSGNYHPHGESVIYPTLVRMAQEWNMRHVLVDKQAILDRLPACLPLRCGTQRPASLRSPRRCSMT